MKFLFFSIAIAAYTSQISTTTHQIGDESGVRADVNLTAFANSGSQTHVGVDGVDAALRRAAATPGGQVVLRTVILILKGYLRVGVAPSGDHHIAEQVEGTAVNNHIHNTELFAEVVAFQHSFPLVQIALFVTQRIQYSEQLSSPHYTPPLVQDSHAHPWSITSECGSSTKSFPINKIKHVAKEE